MATFMKKKNINLSNDDPLMIPLALDLVKTSKTKSYDILCDSMGGYRGYQKTR